MVFDKISAVIMQRRLKSITRQMAVSLSKSSRSLNISEAKDFCTGIYGVRGEIWEQTEFIPLMSYTVPTSIKYIAEYFGADIHPGDIIIHNDPYTGGNQTSDVKITAPVFSNDELMCFAAINAHQADIGGASPGGYNPHAKEIWQEALRITPVKIIDQGVLRYDVWDFIFANIRLTIVEEDIMSMIGACENAVHEINSIISLYGKQEFIKNLSYLFDCAQVSLKKQLSVIKPGIYEASHLVFGDGIDPDQKMVIKLKIIKEPEKLIFDYTGTSEQTAGYVNAPSTVTISGSLMVLLMCIGEVFPINGGTFRDIEFIIPEGTILNPYYPAATGFGNHLTDQIGAVVQKALYQAIPQQVSAGWNVLLCLMLSGYDNKRNKHFSDMLINACKGGAGATYGYDGWSHLGLIGGGGGITAQDPETFEMECPVIFKKFEYAPDSAGKGQWNGGLGVETILELCESDISVNIFGDGMHEESRAFGLAGGSPGGKNSIVLQLPDGNILYPNSKTIINKLPRGTILHQIAGGGGGYGSPEKKNREIK
ncbi:MAG TPA: hydantoinase B/oxoprolinase family protein [Syntrophomonadaceae bacterium]|nr:hydantoinase B/oxoprolinase family protein [Syntrophomonadaceae bacterium]